MTQKNLDKVVSSLQSGDLIDVGTLRNEEGNDDDNGINFVDLYVQGIALKYPMIATKFNSMKSLDKLTLMNRIRPVMPDQISMHQKLKSSSKTNDKNSQDYMGEPVNYIRTTTSDVLRHYGTIDAPR